MDRDSAMYGTPGAGRNSAIMSPASRNIEKSLNELDDLINKRRLELSHLRSNNRVYSADRILQEARDKTTPTTHIGTNHVHTLSSSSSSIRSNNSHSNTSPYLASTLPNAVISNSGTPPGYSPYGSSVPTDRVIAPTYNNARPPLYTSPMPYGNNNYNDFSHNIVSGSIAPADNRNMGGIINAGTISNNQYGYVNDNQDMVTIPSSKYNQLEQQLQYYQNKVPNN